MNTHSWPSALGTVSAKIAVARLRAGFTLVLSTGIVTRWISGQRDAGGEPAEPGREAAPGRRQHDEHEQRGEHDLDDDRRARAR